MTYFIVQPPQPPSMTKWVVGWLVRWVVGWGGDWSGGRDAGEMMNKAKLSLNWAWPGVLAELGKELGLN